MNGAKNTAQRFGIKTITVGSDKFAFVEIIQALRRNELVAMLIDRPYLNSGVQVQFFDHPTLFSAAAARYLAAYPGVGDPGIRLTIGTRPIRLLRLSAD